MADNADIDDDKQLRDLERAWLSLEREIAAVEHERRGIVERVARDMALDHARFGALDKRENALRGAIERNLDDQKRAMARFRVQ